MDPSLDIPVWTAQVGAVFIAARYLIFLGHEVLDLLRDFNDYRSERTSRLPSGDADDDDP